MPLNWPANIGSVESMPAYQCETIHHRNGQYGWIILFILPFTHTHTRTHTHNAAPVTNNPQPIRRKRKK